MDNIRAVIDYVIGSEAYDYENYVTEVWWDRDFSLENKEQLEISLIDPEVDHPYKTAVLAQRELGTLGKPEPVFLDLTMDQFAALVS
jgi:hypothetical protein